MVVDKVDEHRQDRLFHALADTTRRDIVRRTLVREQSISALAKHYPMSFAAVQKHVTVLERAGLVSKHKQGREQLVRGEVATIAQAQAALDHLEQLWRTRIDQIGELLADDQGNST